MYQRIFKLTFLSFIINSVKRDILRMHIYITSCINLFFVKSKYIYIYIILEITLN